jgi:hypothetical protein
LIVIPLAKKLASCGIFEEAGEELLENAIANREEWDATGHEVLEFYVAHYRESHDVEGQKNKDAKEGRENRSQGGESRNDDESAQHRGSTGTLRSVTNSVCSSGDEQQIESDPEIESQLGQSLARLPGAKRDGTSNASVADTISDTDSGIQEPDIVFAVLDSPEDPDDFFSYTLVTSKQLRKRKERQDGHETSTIVSREEMRQRRRRVRRVTSALSIISTSSKSLRDSHNM